MQGPGHPNFQSSDFVENTKRCNKNCITFVKLYLRLNPQPCDMYRALIPGRPKRYTALGGTIVTKLIHHPT